MGGGGRGSRVVSCVVFWNERVLRVVSSYWDLGVFSWILDLGPLALVLGPWKTFELCVRPDTLYYDGSYFSREEGSTNQRADRAFPHLSKVGVSYPA